MGLMAKKSFIKKKIFVVFVMVHSFIVQSPSVQTVHRQMVYRLIKLS